LIRAVIILRRAGIARPGASDHLCGIEAGGHVRTQSQP
jgi:hypothetical protein